MNFRKTFGLNTSVPDANPAADPDAPQDAFADLLCNLSAALTHYPEIVPQIPVLSQSFAGMIDGAYIQSLLTRPGLYDYWIERLVRTDREKTLQEQYPDVLPNGEEIEQHYGHIIEKILFAVSRIPELADSGTNAGALLEQKIAELHKLSATPAVTTPLVRPSRVAHLRKRPAPRSA